MSLVCSGLNAERIRRKAEQLDTENLVQLGGEIIEGFYDERLAPMPASVRRLIERELITPDGVRIQYPIQSALAQGEVTQEQINQLVGQRILRIESIGDSQRVELVHDRLAAVALKRRQDSRAVRGGRTADASNRKKMLDGMDETKKRCDNCGCSFLIGHRGRNVLVV